MDCFVYANGMTLYSRPTIRNCEIAYNSATRGGGIACYRFTGPVIEDCDIHDNSGRPSTLP